MRYTFQQRCATWRDLKSKMMYKLIFTAILIAATAHVYAQIDTVFADQPLANSELLNNNHIRYVMLIEAGHTYRNIKLLDERVEIKGDQAVIVQKLCDGTSVNTDSVIVNRHTLMPFESYSVIQTSKDSFVYHGNKVTGTLTGATKKQLDTSFLKPMFNGLTYAETYQSLRYQKNVPFYIAQYVPGHNVNFEQVKYIRDEEITVNGVSLQAKLLEIKKTAQVTIYCWLAAKTQEILKIEGAFPGFSYSLLKL
jgi:hypothetical protein